MTQGTLPFAGVRKPEPDLPTIEKKVDRILRGMEQSMSQKWKQRALAAVRTVCERFPEFISDDIWTYGELDSTREDRALGSVMRTAAMNRWCVKTDRVRPSKRSNGSGKPVWKSLLYRGSQCG